MSLSLAAGGRAGLERRVAHAHVAVEVDGALGGRGKCEGLDGEAPVLRVAVRPDLQRLVLVQLRLVPAEILDERIGQGVLGIGAEI